MNEPIHWLLIEGIAALFGAGGLYLLVGLCFKIAGSAVLFAWREAIDPLGWLYGAVVIGIQSAVRLVNGTDAKPLLTMGCIAATAVSCVLRIAAMYIRGINANWTAPIQMKLAAGFLSATILVLGYFARGSL